MLFYRGHFYRLAQQPDDERLTTARTAASNILKKYEIDVVGDPHAEQDGAGVDLVYDLKLPGGPPAKLVFDFNLEKEKPRLQEVTAEICRVGYAGVDAASIVKLLEALQIFNQMAPPPGGERALKGREKQQALKMRNWLEYYFPPILAKLQQVLKLKAESGDPKLAEMDLGNRNKLTQQMQFVLQGDSDIGDRRNFQQALKYIKGLDEENWKTLVSFLEARRGRFTPTKKLVQQAVRQLTRHEKYSGEFTILGYEQDRVVVGLAAPAPFDGMILVFSRRPGAPNRLNLVTAGFVYCGNRALETGADVDLAKQMVSAVVDMVMLSQNTANPEFDKPPPEAEAEKVRPLSSEEFEQRFPAGVQIWHYGNDTYQFAYGDDRFGCISADEYDGVWDDPQSDLHQILERVRDAFLVEPDGKVYLLDRRTGEPERVAGKIPFLGSEACPTR